MVTARRQASTLINRDLASHITIYQPYLQICSQSRSPFCAAALIDYLERKTAAHPDDFVPLAFQDFYVALCEAFWLLIIKDTIQWLVNTGYIERRIASEDPDGLQSYRLNWHEIALALSVTS